MDLKAALQQQENEPIEIKTRIQGQTEPAYYKPMTLADHDKIQRTIKVDGKGSEGAALAITLIQKVIDKKGQKLFKPGDKDWLMNSVPQGVLLDIVNEISRVPTIEEAEKN